MPRTFSRGKKILAGTLITLMGYLSISEGEVFVKQMRLFFCPEEELIEKDIFELFDFLKDRFTQMRPRESVVNIKHIEAMEFEISNVERTIANLPRKVRDLPIV